MGGWSDPDPPLTRSWTVVPTRPLFHLMAWVCMRPGQCALPASVSIKRAGTLVQSSPSGEHAELADGGII